MASFPSLGPIVDIWRAKLSRTIAVSVFVSIVLVEIGIFIPSLFREQRDQVNQMAELSNTAMEALSRREDGEETTVDMDGEPTDDAQIAEKLRQNLAANPHLVGIAVYGMNGEVLGMLGETPTLDWSPTWKHSQQPYHHQLSDNWSRLDIAWPSSADHPYSVVMRHDFTQGRTDIGWFVVRIAGLVILISVFVTGVTMVVVYQTTVGPILRLRRDLETVGDNLARDDMPPGPLCCQGDRQDELGDVQKAFDSMYQTIHQEIENRRQAELKSDELLRNILPEAIAERLKQGERSIAERFENATVLFADLVGFTSLAAKLPPGQLVKILNQVFSRFDQLADRYGLEKIKTIGDAYMVVGGVPTTHPHCSIAAIAEMGLAMLDALEDLNHELHLSLRLRIGIHHGPVVAGVIGLRKFIYDLWGDTVNIASRMESHGSEGRIHTTDVVYSALRNSYDFEERGVIPIKGRGDMNTYWLLKRISPEPAITTWQTAGWALNPVSVPLEQS